MINSLFSMFDPSSSILKITMFFIVFFVFVLISHVKKVLLVFNQALLFFVQKIKQETNFILANKKGNVLLTISIILFILVINLIALFPQNFANTAQLTVTLVLALFFWLSTLIFGITINTKHFLSHLVPQGTPTFLMNFIVLIELTRNLIRPITLCVRLTANIVAGHLLMSLLNNFLINRRFFVFVSIRMTPFILTILETAVAFIQAYVFVTLVTLYSRENQ